MRTGNREWLIRKNKATIFSGPTNTESWESANFETGLFAPTYLCGPVAHTPHDQAAGVLEQNLYSVSSPALGPLHMPI